MGLPQRVPKDWGYEIIFANDVTNNYCGKMLFVENNFQTSLHKHFVKDEVFYVVTGIFNIEFAGDHPDVPQEIFSRTLLPGARLHVPVGRWHRIIAAGTAGRYSQLVEVSTYHDDNDVARAVVGGRVSPG